MFTTKVYRPEIKVLDKEAGRVSAIVSSESMDRDGDVIRAEGWDLKNFMRHPVLLASHAYHSLRSQIGTWESMEVVNGKMRGVARFFIGKGNPEADWAFELAQEKSLAFSVGFIPDMDKAAPLHSDDTFGTRGMEFRGQELLEVSAVSIPSNADALQRFVKTPNIHPVLVEIAKDRLTEPEDDLPFSDLDKEIEIRQLDEMDIEAIVSLVMDRIAERITDSDEPEEEDDSDEDVTPADDPAEEEAEAEEAEGRSSAVADFDWHQVAQAAIAEALEEDQ